MSARLPLWALLVAIAVAGSLCFGATLPSLSRGALWFTISSGTAWVFFIPFTAVRFRTSLAESIHVALLTMAAGEAVLVSTAAINWAIGAQDWRIFAAEVALSNIVMATAFAVQFRSRGISITRSLTAWMLGLNLTGALMFLFFWITIL